MEELSIINFYLGKVPAPQGLTIEEMWQFTDQGLERGHTYIQWLFPLREPSPHNPDALTLDSETEETFRTSEELKWRLFKSFLMMLRFYQLQIAREHIDEDGYHVEITRLPEWVGRRPHWISPMNHNFLRMTRIMTSLRLLGLPNYSQALFDYLKTVAAEYPVISPTTMEYWEEAAGMIKPPEEPE